MAYTRQLPGITRYGVVGSRRRTDEESVRDFVKSLPRNSMIISGGARGPDSWSVSEAKKQGLLYIEYLPQIREGMAYYEVVQELFARNTLIANACDILVAFVHPDRKGGTEDTIKKALALGKEVWIKDLTK